ncbi:hypothetical protein M5G22_24355 [Pseudomonas sp. TNT2022 ID233]|uniref:hypothetical protein n=1 Tax=Pseudomonas aphyarum TaxID=2942629 RepID=UPI002361EE78|nr:hypothetical protein [Pseudomonas aphyarum]MDD1140705.1 hypothetical protein [Pseudomonas aphyarum]
MSINVNSTQITTLLQLYPMAIPGAVENLQPPGAYHLGIPESIHSPSTKLLTVIDPVRLFSTPFAAGDSVRLWVNGQATSVIKNIYPGEENDRIFLELLWGVLKNGLNTLYYEVTRVSGNKDQSTPILNVLFNNPVSGITASHPASVGPVQPAVFTFTRNNPREYDEVTLTVGAWRKTIPYVHPANPFTYTLTTTDQQQIGDGTHSLSATLVDQLSNIGSVFTSSIKIGEDPTVVEDFEGYSEMGFPIGQKVELNTMFIEALSGSTHPPQLLHGPDLSPLITGKRLYAVFNRTGTTRFDFKSSWSSFRVGVFFGGSPAQVIKYFFPDLRPKWSTYRSTTIQ